MVTMVLMSISACSKSSVNNTVESSGYASTAAAVAAYIEGLKENNLDKMISTFAVEHYVDNYDLQAFFRKNAVVCSYAAKSTA